jgi:MinD superfamily P-loop ATPase
MKTLLLLSGKGGTGKTTTATAFIALSKAKAFADCDVDAPNLHLLQDFQTPGETTPYYGSEKACIDPTLCRGCGKCAETCRFEAIYKKDDIYAVNAFACEGCGVCTLVCPHHAPALKEDQAGELTLYRDDRVFSTAELKMGRGNSGKLVSQVKTALNKNSGDAAFAVIDGSPGIGCPVIASVSGVTLALVVAEPSLSGISDLTRLIQTASTFAVPLAVCVNKADTCPENTEKIRAFCKEKDLPYLGEIPFDPKVSQGINQGVSIVDIGGPAAQALKEIYGKVMDLLETLPG